MTISVNISKTLLDITGEPRAEVAIFAILKDAVEHRIEKIEAGISSLEEKYGMPFKDFEEKFKASRISDPYGLEAEADFLEWEGLNSRLMKYKSLLSDLS